jgi:hypothetical protein
MAVKLIYDMSSLHDLVVALEGIGLALMVIALHDAFKKNNAMSSLRKMLINELASESHG